MKEIMAAQVKKLYEMGIVDASFIGLDSTPVIELFYYKLVIITSLENSETYLLILGKFDEN